MTIDVLWDQPDIYDQFSLTFKEQTIAPIMVQTETAHDEQLTSQLPIPLRITTTPIPRKNPDVPR